MALLSYHSACGGLRVWFRRQTWRASATALALLLQLSPALAAQDAMLPGNEKELKVAFLYNFALYTEWPSLPAQGLVLCVLGRDELGTALDAFASRQVNGKPVLVRHLESATDITDCHMVYLPEVPDAKSSNVARDLREKPILSVTDTASDGLATISLERSGNRLVFDINNTSARAAGLVLSSKLLRLARSVH